MAIIPGWPFTPGEGPFRVKGGSYRGHQIFMDERVPGGFAGVVAGLDPELQEFYAQPFLASSWYDLAPLVAMAPVCGEALGITADEYVRMRSRAQVEQDIRGVYGFLVKLVSGRTIATRLPRFIAMYFDFIETTTRSVGDDHIVTEHHGLPRPLAPWLHTVAGAYIEQLLVLSKGGDPRVEVRALPEEGEAHGIPLVGFELDVRVG